MQASRHPKVTGVATVRTTTVLQVHVQKETLLGELCFPVSCLLHNSAGDASLQRQWVASSFPDITPHCPLAQGNIIVEFPSGFWGDTSQGTAFSGTLENEFQGSTGGKISSKFPGYSIPGTSLSLVCLLQQGLDLSWAVCFSRRNSGCFLQCTLASCLRFLGC